jgi:hypothetical protein
LKSLKYFILLIVTISIHPSAKAQRMNLYSFDNLSGIAGVINNPANVADSRHRLNVHILGIDAFATNNYVNVQTPYGILKSLTGNIDTQYIDKNGVPLFLNEYINEKLNGNKKFVNVQFATILPSVMWTGKDRQGFAFNWQIRANAHLSGLDESILKIFQEDFDTTSPDYVPFQNQLRYIGLPGTQKRMGAGVNSWIEYNFSYGRVIYEDGPHFIKAGATLKLLEGLGAAYIKVNNLNYDLQRVDSINFSNADFEYGYVSEQYYDRKPGLKPKNLLGTGSPGWGLGLDLGVIYEYRPKYKKYVYQMDRERWVDPSQNKYLYKVGLSLLDFGSIRYKKEGYTKFVHVQSGDEITGWSQFKKFQKNDKSTEIDAFMFHLFPNSDSSNKFKAKLPFALNLNYDHNVATNWYVSARYIQSMRRKKTIGVRVQNSLTLATRYERNKLAASFAFSFGRFYNPVHAAMTVRWGPFYVGTDVLSGVSGKKINSASVYTGFMVPILAKKQKDTDGDMLSDPLDKCPKIPGDPFADGCPDKDGDKINDFDDACPDLYGPAIYHGCPDDDNDGVIGYADKCPQAKGDSLHWGCPDSDGDGVFDYEDECLLQKGRMYLNGCPDSDNDSIADHLDKCPDIPGIARLEGCPPPETFITGDQRIDTCNFVKFKYQVVVGSFIGRSDAEKYTILLRKNASLLTTIAYDNATKLYYVFAANPLSREDAYQWLLKFDKQPYKKYISERAHLKRKE